MRERGLPRVVPALAAALCAAAACTSARHGAAPSPSPAGASAPLRACETRELTLAGADVVVIANADGTPASIEVASAPSAAARRRALRATTRAFGAPRPDPQIVAHQSKWGLVTWTDGCGRPVRPPR